MVLPFQLAEILALDKGDELECGFDIENRVIFYRKCSVAKDR